MNERKKRTSFRKESTKIHSVASRAREICFTGRRGDRWGVSSCQQIGRTGLRVAQRKQRKRDDGGYLLETVGKTRTDILRRWRAKKKKRRGKECSKRKDVRERREQWEMEGGREKEREGGREEERERERERGDRERQVCAGTTWFL